MRSVIPMGKTYLKSATNAQQRTIRYAPAFTLMLLSALSGCAEFNDIDGKCHSAACSADAKITANVQTNFGQHPELQAPDLLQVQTINHVVYLEGMVSTGLQRDQAESVALQTPGVTRVVNNISISK